VPPLRLATIVEGDGEVEALPILVRAWFPEAIVLKPLRVSRDRFLRNLDEQRRFARLARQLGADRLLVLLDAHGGCPAEIAASLMISLGEDFRQPLAVVLAVQEFETWFLQCLPELSRHVGVIGAEGLQGAKERVASIRGRYTPTADQASLTAQLARLWPFLEGRQVPRSLEKLHRDLTRLLA
jgi:hypothetical protein